MIFLPGKNQRGLYDTPLLRGWLSDAVIGSAGGNTPDCTCAFAGINAYAAVKRPTNINQWPCVGTDVTEPDYFMTFQETTGSIVDSVTGFALPPTGNVRYEQIVTDWTTEWAGSLSETNNQGFYVDRVNGIGQGWNTAVQSIFVCGYSLITSATAERILFVLSGTPTTSAWVSVQAAGTLKLNRAAVTATGSVVFEAATPTPFVWTMQWDRRGSGAYRLVAKKLGTNADTINASWATHVDGGKGYNVNNNAAPPIALHNMLAVWVGDKAEAMFDRGGTNAGGATIISDLGW